MHSQCTKFIECNKILRLAKSSIALLLNTLLTRTLIFWRWGHFINYVTRVTPNFTIRCLCRYRFISNFLILNELISLDASYGFQLYVLALFVAGIWLTISYISLTLGCALQDKPRFFMSIFIFGHQKYDVAQFFIFTTPICPLCNH